MGVLERTMLIVCDNWIMRISSRFDDIVSADTEIYCNIDLQSCIDGKRKWDVPTHHYPKVSMFVYGI